MAVEGALNNVIDANAEEPTKIARAKTILQNGRKKRVDKQKPFLKLFADHEVHIDTGRINERLLAARTSTRRGHPGARARENKRTLAWGRFFRMKRSSLKNRR
jgi:hypothetical protein